MRLRYFALGLIFSGSAFAADTISATHVFPASLIYSRSFLEFVKKANEAGKGVFAIQVRGGPEAIGMMEQPGAVRSGVVDMVYTPCAFYAAVVPECDAVSASSVDGPTARKNGGLELLDQIHQKRMGVKLLGWVDSGIRFCLWSTKEPKFDANGQIDIRGFKVRGNPIYNAFLTNYLGAQVINLNSSELYTALERGTVDITAWTQIGLMDLNWDRYIKYRILPDFFEASGDCDSVLMPRFSSSARSFSQSCCSSRRLALSCSIATRCRSCGRRSRPSCKSAASATSRNRTRPRSASSRAPALRACSA